MTGLLDVNVLIALFDANHLHHETAHHWFGDHSRNGWATCPITENGFLRVISNPAYPGSHTTLADAVQRLRIFRKSGGHTFWTDSVSFCDGIFDPTHVRGHRQQTDIYLLGLAASRGGRLVTFDRGIALEAIHDASQSHLEVISVTPRQ